MPTSHHSYIVDALDAVRYLKPKSVLDIGIGFGKWGHLFREYLDVMAGRIFRNEWQTSIDGIEIYPKYITDHQKDIYSKVYIGDAVDAIKTLPNYDLIFASDVIEHIEKGIAVKFIKTILNHCKSAILIIPLGQEWLSQKGMYGNPNEAHVSSWDLFELDSYKQLQKPKVHVCNKKKIGMYVLKGNLS